MVSNQRNLGSAGLAKRITERHPTLIFTQARRRWLAPCVKQHGAGIQGGYVPIVYNYLVKAAFGFYYRKVITGRRWIPCHVTVVSSSTS